MILFKQYLGEISFSFDRVGAEIIAALIISVKAGGEEKLTLSNPETGNEVEFFFIKSDEDEYAQTKNKITFFISEDSCDYAIDKLGELEKSNGFSTPEFAQFYHRKERGKRQRKNIWTCFDFFDSVIN